MPNFVLNLVPNFTFSAESQCRIKRRFLVPNLVPNLIPNYSAELMTFLQLTFLVPNKDFYFMLFNNKFSM